MKKNDIFTTQITSYTSEGLGICRINEMAVFVPETAVGDILEVRITKVMKSYAYGKKERIITASASRTDIDCPAFPRCGGCDFRHISYEEELLFKKRRVEDALRHITGIDLLPEKIIGAEKICFYRNKAQFPVKMYDGKPELGFYRERSHDIIPIDLCRIQRSECKDIISALKQWMKEYDIPPYDETTLTGTVRHLYVRSSSASGEFLVCIVTNTDVLPRAEVLTNYITKACPAVGGIVHNINKSSGNKILGDEYKTVYGRDYIYDNIGNLRFKISARSFFQVNTEQAYKLYLQAKEYAGLTGKENVVDLYCGTGTIGLFMADSAKKVFGMEIIPEAIADAKQNAAFNGISNAEFRVGDAADFDGSVFGKDNSDCIVFVDPPRKGLTEKLICTIADMKPVKTVYISCDPATMARDLKLFIQKGYTPVKCTAVDMFPRTRHVESVALLLPTSTYKNHV